MNVTVPFSFGALPMQHASDAVADEEMRRRTRKVLVPLSLVAGAVCAWALIATLTAVAPRGGSIEADSQTPVARELQASMPERFAMPVGTKFADSMARPLTIETGLAGASVAQGEFN